MISNTNITPIILSDKIYFLELFFRILNRLKNHESVYNLVLFKIICNEKNVLFISEFVFHFSTNIPIIVVNFVILSIYFSLK